MTQRSGPILFTGFEPSGDDHASAVIAHIKRHHPDAEIFAWGGPKMEAAGATIVERTGKDAVMGLPGPGKIIEHLKINQRVRAWMDEHKPVVHVPVDSPAANFPICKLAKQRGTKVVHLVAPQVWAWGSWRVKKIRRLSDLVLCLLPFEPDWFAGKGVRARFVGHPLFDEALDPEELDRACADFPGGSPRIALMPGSRPKEITKNFPLMLETFRAIRAEYTDAVGLVAATTPEVVQKLRAIADENGGWAPGLHVVHGETDAVIRWSSLAVVVSGTVTLQIARQQRPMVTVFKADWWFYQLFARWVVTLDMFTLPNLIAGKRIVPELVPHFGGAAPLTEAVKKLLRDQKAAQQQREDLEAVREKFAGYHAARDAAIAIAEVAGLEGASGADLGEHDRA